MNRNIGKRSTARRRLRRLGAIWVLVCSVILAGPGAWVGQASALDLSGLLSLLMPQQQAPVAPPPPSPFDAAVPLPPDSGIGRRVVYSLGGQRVWLVEEGELVIGSWPVSGRAGVPPPGSYQVFSRSRYARAQRPGVSMEYMVRFAPTQGLDVGFHAIPVNRKGVPIQTDDQLGTYQSLGCVRQRHADAIRMWEFAQIGTPVFVTP